MASSIDFGEKILGWQGGVSPQEDAEFHAWGDWGNF